MNVKIKLENTMIKLQLSLFLLIKLLLSYISEKNRQMQHKSSKKLQLQFNKRMGFWHKVVDELEYQGKSRKQLAMEADFDVSTIGTGLKRNGMPQADLALRIAKALNVPIEYLVDNEVKDIASVPKKTTINEWIDLLAKYKKILNSLECMPAKTRTAIIRMIEEIV